MSIPSSPKELMAEIRGHPQFPQLVASIQVPPPPSYNPSQDAKPPEKQAFDFAYHSGFEAGALWALAKFGITPE